MARVDPLRFLPEEALPAFSLVARVPCIGLGFFGIYGSWYYETFGWFFFACLFMVSAGFIPASWPGSSKLKSAWLAAISTLALIFWIVQVVRYYWLHNTPEHYGLFGSFYLVVGLVFLALLGARPIGKEQSMTPVTRAGSPES